MAKKPDETIEALLDERRAFPPGKAFARQANVRDASVYRKADRNFEKFWADFARELSWFKPWKKVLDWKPPRAKWFVGGKLNASVNCLDRHLDGPRRNKAALIWEGEPGDQRVLTYRELHREVCRFAQRPEVSRHPQGRPRDALPPDDPGAARRDARVRADRGDPLGRLRRILGRVPARPHQRPGGAAARDGRRRLAAREGGAPEGDRRRGARGDADDRERRRREADRERRVAGPRGATAGGATSWRRFPRGAIRRRWTPRIPSTSCTRRARPGSPRASCTRRGDTSSGPTPRRSGSSTSRKKTSTGARPTSAG